MIDEVLVGLIFGFIGGFAGGLLGVGGGIIYVPAMAMVLLLDESQHVAQGVSLGAIIATGIVGGVTHLRRGNVDVSTAIGVAPAAIIAGFAGALAADKLDADILRRIFAVVVLYFGINMIWRVLRSEREPTREVEV
jgi:uncharacterized membrane protein YfcA